MRYSKNFKSGLVWKVNETEKFFWVRAKKPQCVAGLGDHLPGEEGPMELYSHGLSESYLLKHFRVQHQQPKSIPAQSVQNEKQTAGRSCACAGGGLGWRMGRVVGLGREWLNALALLKSPWTYPLFSQTAPELHNP